MTPTRSSVLVTAAVADSDGNFSRSAVPPGYYKLTACNVGRSRRIGCVVEVGSRGRT